MSEGEDGRQFDAYAYVTNIGNMSQKKESKKAAAPQQSEQNADNQVKADGRIQELEAKVEELEKGAAELGDKLAKEKDSYIRLMAAFLRGKAFSCKHGGRRHHQGPAACAG